MTRRACGYSSCGQVVSQISQLGLCIRHEQAAWEFLTANNEKRRRVRPCPQCNRNAASSRKTGWCDACEKRAENAKRMEKRNG